LTAPSYTTDLTPINNGESGTWVEMTGWANGGTPQVNTTEWYIQGGGCVTATMNNKTLIQSIAFDNTSNITFSTDDCFFMWQVCLASNVPNTFANGGIRAVVGSQQGNFNAWKTGGSDYSPNPYGGWKNVAVDPTYTADYTVGSPESGNYRFFGSGLLPTAAVQKGEMHCVDILTYGRGDLLVEYGDAGNGYATFSGMAANNDNSSNRWGLFQEIDGGYLWKGLMSIGTSTNAVDFRDSNVNIFIDDTPRTYANFNTIDITNASSNVEWTGVNITTLNPSGLSIGRLTMTDDASVTIDTCTFTDMGTFVFDANATIVDTTFRRCGQVTQAGADIDDCILDESDAAVSILCDNPNNIDNCAFVSDGSNHGLELTTACAGNSYTLTGCTWANYASVDGDTGNECIYNNSAGAVTLSVGTAAVPTIRNGGGASTTVNSSVTLYIIVKDEDGDPIQNVQTAVYKTSDRSQIVNQDTDINGEVDTSYSGTTPVEVEVRCRKGSSGATKYVFYSSIQTIATTTGLSMSITLEEDPNNNATS
jgi:hypothetical protein